MKKVISIFVCLTMALTLLMTLIACGSSIQDDWSSVILGENLPTPQKGRLRSGSNLENCFFGGIEKVNADYYSEYKNACIEMGYTIESKELGEQYEAFNADGYDLSLYFDGDEIDITLSAPEKLAEFEWPTTGIGSKLPAPVSTLCKVTSDSSKSFKIIVGNTTIDDYNNYVKTCESKGFVVDYIKNEHSYSAKNAEGYRLHTSYLGCNRIEVMIQIPNEENTTTSTEITSQKQETSNNELSKDFKEAMDSYEKFMDEYVSFMKKYKENPTDISLLSDYATYISKYTDFVVDFEKWENQEKNAAETAYYIDVQARVSKKLLEVAQ